MVFRRPIRDCIPIVGGNYEPSAGWILTRERREQALARRHIAKGSVLSEHTKELTPLSVGDVVQVQNQTGCSVKKWDKSGSVVEVLPFKQYRVKIDGPGRVTLRARQFL